MKEIKLHGWRMYQCSVLCEGRVGVNKMGRTKWYPDDCPLNSQWISRAEAARVLRLERAFAAVNIPKKLAEYERGRGKSGVAS